IMISAEDGYPTDGVIADINSLMRERRKLPRSVANNFSVTDTRQIADAVSSSTQVMTSLLGAVAGVSLLVGGIGIMNIMLASVLERTREIGVRRAIGATRRDIRSQFVIESFAISFLGGVAGIIIGIVLARIVAAYAGWPTVITISSLILSTGVSITVGLVSGIYPAARAAELNPVEALRYE
ncbi:MAG TPA: FtsX-like permease family protein, partial [Thermoanaerobaculia bacterium]